MKSFRKDNHSDNSSDNKRREFIRKMILIGTFTGVGGLSMMSSCKEEGDEEIGPAEDLMREHGVLNRIMLIYDACRRHLINGEPFSPEVLQNSSLIIRNFIEDYHEKLEEEFLFPRFAKANQLVDLVQVLYIQHSAGRKMTDRIIQLGKLKMLNEPDGTQPLIKLLNDFNAMYRPHEAREDTVLFPALRKIVSPNEYSAIGEDFEKKEHELFGENGFETMVEKVAIIEKQLGIFELSEFTPHL